MSATMLRRTSPRSLFPSKLHKSPAPLILSFRRYESTEAAPQPTTPQARRRRDENRPLIARTHFLTLPLYENAELRTKLENFRESLLASDPPIKGLSPVCVIPKVEQALEVRLGSINIQGYPSTDWAQKRIPASLREEPQPESGMGKPAVELERVMEVLQGLKTPIQNILTANGGDGILRIPIGRIRPLLHGTRERFNPRKVNVLFLEPVKGSATEPLQSINALIFEEFNKAGLWVDTPRQSSLTMTLINSRNNTTQNGKRIHFDMEQLYASEAFKAVQGEDLSAAPVDWAEPRPVDFGTAVASGIHLSKVGAWSGEQGAAPPDGKIELPTA